MRNARKAVVTGSTSGIGLGIARALAAHGNAVMLNGFGDSEAIDHLRANMSAEFGIDVLYNDADLSQPTGCISLITDAEKRLGAVDVLVNNAGIQYISSMEAFPAAQWDSIIAINLSAAFHTIQTALPGMRQRQWGRIVNVASVHGLVASAQKSAYVAAKHGLIGLTKVVALETAESGITCNAICPGWVFTPMVEKQVEMRAKRAGTSLEQAVHELLSEKQPTGRFTTVEQIGAVVMFLCSEAADNLTGTSIPVDGGWTAQ